MVTLGKVSKERVLNLRKIPAAAKANPKLCELKSITCLTILATTIFCNNLKSQQPIMPLSPGERPPSQEQTAAQFLVALGWEHYNKKRFERAVPLFRESLALLKEGHLEEIDLYGLCKFRLGISLLAECDLQAARTEIEESQTIVFKRFGENSPQYYEVTATLAKCAWLQENYQLAHDLYIRTERGITKLTGAGNYDFALCQANLSCSYLGLEKYPEALKAIRTSLELYNTSNINNENLRIRWIFLLTECLIRSGDLKEAQSNLDTLSKYIKNTPDTDHHLQAKHWWLTGLVLLDLGRLDEAANAFQKSSQLYRSCASDAPVFLAKSLDSQAIVAIKTNKMTIAVSCAEEADKIRQRICDVKSPMYARHLEEYLALLRAAKRFETASTVEARIARFRSPH